MGEGAGHGDFGGRLNAHAVEVFESMHAHKNLHGGSLALGKVAMEENAWLAVVERQHFRGAGGGEEYPTVAQLS